MSFVLLTYFLLFLVYGLQVLEQSAVRGRELLSGREGKGEVISLKVAFKGGS